LEFGNVYNLVSFISIMKKDDELLEEKSREFLRLRIEEDPDNLGFNPREIKEFFKYVRFVNYLLEKKYLAEKDLINKEEVTVKSVRYVLTNAGRAWAYR